MVQKDWNAISITPNGSRAMCPGVRDTGSGTAYDSLAHCLPRQRCSSGGVITAGPASAASLRTWLGDLRARHRRVHRHGRRHAGAVHRSPDERLRTIRNNEQDGDGRMTWWCHRQRLSPPTAHATRTVLSSTSEVGDSTNLTSPLRCKCMCGRKPTTTILAACTVIPGTSAVPTAHRATVLGNLATMRAGERESCGEPSVDVAISMADPVQRHPHRQCVTDGAEWERGAHGCDVHRRHHLKSIRNRHIPDRGETSCKGVPEYRVTASASYSGAGLGAG